MLVELVNGGAQVNFYREIFVLADDIVVEARDVVTQEVAALRFGGHAGVVTLEARPFGKVVCDVEGGR